MAYIPFCAASLPLPPRLQLARDFPIAYLSLTMIHYPRDELITSGRFGINADFQTTLASNGTSSTKTVYLSKVTANPKVKFVNICSYSQEILVYFTPHLAVKTSERCPGTVIRRENLK